MPFLRHFLVVQSRHRKPFVVSDGTFRSLQRDARLLPWRVHDKASDSLMVTELVAKAEKAAEQDKLRHHAALQQASAHLAAAIEVTRNLSDPLRPALAAAAYRSGGTPRMGSGFSYSVI